MILNRTEQIWKWFSEKKREVHIFVCEKAIWEKLLKKGQTLKFKVSLISNPPPPLHQCECVMEDNGWKGVGEGFNKNINWYCVVPVVPSWPT